MVDTMAMGCFLIYVDRSSDPEEGLTLVHRQAGEPVNDDPFLFRPDCRQHRAKYIFDLAEHIVHGGRVQKLFRGVP